MGARGRSPQGGEARGSGEGPRPIAVLGFALGLALWILAVAWVSGAYPLVDPDEGRNAEVAREMAAGGSWSLPAYQGLPYLDKPLLWFDAAALSMRLLGPTERAARAPSLIFTVATILLVWLLAGHFYGARRGHAAALAVAGSPLVVVYAQVAIFDAMLTFFIVASLAAFWLALDRQDPAPTDARLTATAWAVLAWLAIALGTLTKGPVAILVPLLVAVPYGWWRRRLRRVLSPWGVLVFFLLVLPWTIHVEARVPGFLRYALISETWARITTDIHDRQGPLWYFAPFLVAGSLPWFVGAVAGWWRSGRRLSSRGQVLFPLLWIALPLVFFSLSQSKRPHYVLPLMGAVALLFAYNFDDAQRRRSAARAAAWTALLLGLFLFAVSFASPSSWSMPAYVADRFAATTRMLGSWFALVGVGAVAVATRRASAAALLVAVAFSGFPVVARPLLWAIADERSSAAMAEAIQLECSGAEVVAVRFLPFSLPFYLRAPVIVSTFDRRALPGSFLQASWERYQHSHMVRPPEYWQSAAQGKEPVVLVFDAEYEDYRFVERTGRQPLYVSDHWLAYGNCLPSGG